VQSGDKAQYAYANQAALDYYQRALEAAQRVTPPVAPAQVFTIYQSRSQVFMVLARYLDAAEESKTMLELARAVGDRANEGRALVDVSRSYFFSFRSEFADEARRCAEDARVIAEEIGDGRFLAASLGSLGSMDQADGDLEEGDRKFHEAVRISEEKGFPDVGLQSRMFLGAHANWRAEFRRAIVLSRETEKTSVEVHDGVNELMAMAFRCLSEIALGEYADGLATINAGLLKAKDRNNSFIQGRLTNSLGWLRQELGDFGSAIELDRESVDIGEAHQEPERRDQRADQSRLRPHEPGRRRQRSAAPGGDDGPRREVRVRGPSLAVVDSSPGLPRAEALIAAGRPEEALIPLEEALVQARSTGCMKYVGKAHALRAQTAAVARRWRKAEPDAVEAVRIAREIAYPTLIWQAAHLLADIQAQLGKGDEAGAAARLAAETIEGLAARAPDSALRRSFMNWSRVQAALETAERLRRA
jgi:tetratricopeptide (TPR) repeat protein